MTSKLTRERLEEIRDYDTCVTLDESAELARMALAAMDSEPAIIVGDDGGDALAYRRLIQSFAPGTKLYRHAQPPVTDKQPAVAVGGYRKLFTCSGCGAEGLDEPLESRCHCGMEGAHWIEGKVYLAPQPAPVVPEALNRLRSIVADPKRLPRRKEWISGQKYSYVLLEEVEAIVDEACRAAMLQAGNSPVQPYCRPAQNSVAPAQSPIDHGYRPDCECTGCKATARICAELAGWIPVSGRMPETDGNYWGWWSESKRQGPVWFIKSELQAQFQSHEITHWMPLPAAPQEVKGE